MKTIKTFYEICPTEIPLKAGEVVWHQDSLHMGKYYQKFRKLPVEIKAVRLDEEILIETLEGIMKGSAGDWLVEGVNGEIYPIKNDIFEKTYENIDIVPLKLRKPIIEINELNKGNVFIKHIQNHLEQNQEVICKICNKTVDEIYDEEG